MYPRPIQITSADHPRLILRFTDDTQAELDFSPMLQRGGVFGELRDPAVFSAVRVDEEAQTIVWPNGVDLCPDVLYNLATGAPLPGPVDHPPARLVRVSRGAAGAIT